jgi:23S rRNA pseudouridine1911/1915/1917 synthase
MSANGIEFLYRDQHLFAINKPASIHSVRLTNGGALSLADMLLSQHPELAQASRSTGDAGLVQRLDFDTSGVILGATSRQVWEQLHAALLEGRVKKSYTALVHGEFKAHTNLTTHIGSPYRGAKKVKIYTSPPPASCRALLGTTKFAPIRYFPNLNMSLVSASASPARRHQIRAHAAHLGHPLVGDTLYGTKQTLPLALCTDKRSFILHASELILTHPQSGEILRIESALKLAI